MVSLFVKAGAEEKYCLLFLGRQLRKYEHCLLIEKDDRINKNIACHVWKGDAAIQISGGTP